MYKAAPRRQISQKSKNKQGEAQSRFSGHPRSTKPYRGQRHENTVDFAGRWWAVGHINSPPLTYALRRDHTEEVNDDTIQGHGQMIKFIKKRFKGLA